MIIRVSDMPTTNSPTAATAHSMTINQVGMGFSFLVPEIWGFRDKCIHL